MKRLRLVRVSEHNGATMGVLCVDDVPEFVTLEDAWRDNERMISCIPVGRYKVKPRNSPKFGRIGSESAILASRSAFNRFMDLMAGTPEAELVVIDSYGGGRVH